MKKANDLLNDLQNPNPSSSEPVIPPTKTPSPKQEKPKRSPEEKKVIRAAKKEARKAKKAAQKARKEAKHNPAVLYIPEKMQGFRFSLPLGYLLRFFAIAFSIFGVLWLFCDAFKLTVVSPGNLLLYCFGAVTAFSLIFIGKWFILVGIGIIGAYIGLFFAVAGNPLTFFVSGTQEVINSMMTRLSEAGFAAFGTVSFPYFGGLSYESREVTLTYGGVFALATVLALIFAAFSAKRTRLLPMLITGGGLCLICFTYNLCETNWGIACVLAGLCSAAVLSAYDKTYKAHKHSKKSRAYSGYSAALAGLLSLVILFVPASSMTEPWGEIGFIAAPMKQARTVITTILTGGNPKYNTMNSLTEQRSNALEEHSFEDAELFEVQSYVNRAIYLRSWIAKDFSYADNAWTQLSSLDYSEMLREIQNETVNFTGDQITYDRYTLLDPALSEESLKQSLSISNPDLGYVSTYVDIEYVKNSGLLYLLPSAYVPMGLFEFESRTDSYHERYEIHADGMYSSGWFNLFKEYSAVSILPNYMSSDYGNILAQTQRYYELLFEHANMVQGSTLSFDEMLANFRTALDAEGLTAFKVDALNDYLLMTATQRAHWFRRYVHLYEDYTEYVRSTYLSVPDIESIDKIYYEIMDDIESADNDHEKIMAVIDYLSEHYSYTLTPSANESGRYTNDLDYFLLEGKEGYCVQFATAASLILRRAGYPTRYVQGYIATDFETSQDSSENFNFTSTVTDTNAHAWIEVYIDGIGWRTYETTPAFYSALYYVDQSSGDPSTDTDVTKPPVTTGNTPITTSPTVTSAPYATTAEVTDENGSQASTLSIDLALLAKALLMIAVSVALITMIAWQIRRAKKISDGRMYFIDRAEYGSFEEKSDFDRVAGVICDSIYEIHYIIGNRPKAGELPTEFAARIDSAPLDDSKQALRRYNRLMMLPSTMSEVTKLIEKQEFGKTMNRTELAVLGAYLRALINTEYRHLSVWKKLWYRYIRFMI